MKRRIFFRVDANQKIGRGHLSRCMAIAEMLDNNFSINIVSKFENKAYMENLKIPYKLQTISTEDDFFNIINQGDIVWLDGYEFKESFKRELRSKIYKLIETNDIPYQAENVDVIFNHTPGIKPESFGSIGNTKLYLGLEYALLRGAFLEIAKKNKTALSGTGVFICFGGADTYNLGFQFVKELIKQNFNDPIYWVTNNDTEAIQTSNVHRLNNLDENQMIAYMEMSKVLLIPSSVLSFEAIALRKPFYTGYFIGNQKLIAEGLEKESLAKGCKELTLEKNFFNTLANLFKFYNDEKQQQALIHRQQKLIDGHSASRILKVLQTLS